MTLHYLWTQKQSKWEDFQALKASENDDFWAQKTSLWLWLDSGPKKRQNGTISGPRTRQYDQENLYEAKGGIQQINSQKYRFIVFQMTAQNKQTKKH